MRPLARLVALADGEEPLSVTPEPPDLSAFVASLSSAWRAGEVRPTFYGEAKPRYLRSLQGVVQPGVAQMPKNVVVLAAVTQPVAPTPPSIPAEKIPDRPQPIYAERGTRTFHALTMIWPLVCRRLEGFPNINSTQLFEELCTQFPGRFHPWHLKRLTARVKVWRRDARARGVVIGRLRWALRSQSASGTRPGSPAFQRSLARNASISGSASGSDCCGTAHRIPSAVSWVL